MATRLLLALALVVAVPAGAACRVEGGERVKPVVELFTSEGCSSCPPADRWLSSRFPPAERGGEAVVLAYHVDYWDALGWKDRFAFAAASERQRQAAQANRSTSVYTPQVLLHGHDFGLWRSASVENALTTAAARPARAALTLTASASEADVAVEAQVVPPSGGAVVIVAYTDSGHVTAVRAGENGGATLKHDHVVRAFERYRIAEGSASVRVRFTRPAQPGTHPTVVVLVQDPSRGDVLQAAALPLKGCGR